jgi:anti-anti-sigma factor
MLAMDQCPLCESFVRVAPEVPCYMCGLTLIEIDSDKPVAIIPGWFFVDLARLRSAQSALRRVHRVTENVILDLAEIRFLSSAGLAVLMALNSVVQESKIKLVLANVGPDVQEEFLDCKLSTVFRIVDGIEQGLASFKPG